MLKDGASITLRTGRNVSFTLPLIRCSVGNGGETVVQLVVMGTPKLRLRGALTASWTSAESFWKTALGNIRLKYRVKK